MPLSLGLGLVWFSMIHYECWSVHFGGPFRTIFWHLGGIEPFLVEGLLLDQGSILLDI